MGGLTSYQRPAGYGGIHYSTSWRCYRRGGGIWLVERWNGIEWELIDRVDSYARCRQIPGEWEAQRAKS